MHGSTDTRPDMNDFKTYFTKTLRTILTQNIFSVDYPIYLFVGVEQYVSLPEFEEWMADKESFDSDENQLSSDETYVGRMLSRLVENAAELPFMILSLSQFHHIRNRVPEAVPTDRVVVVTDGIRHSYSLPYLPEEFSRKIYLTKTQRLTKCVLEERVEELEDTPHAIDDIVNRFLAEGNPPMLLAIPSNRVKMLSAAERKRLERLNWLLSQSGGGCVIGKYEQMPETYFPSQTAVDLLHKYWGDWAVFRDLNLYADPDSGCKRQIPVSQGYIVDTLIRECDNARDGNDYRDLFLTAPTGAGKSLLFQLPAFYVSENNAVTIVVSPLIALMGDQVRQIYNERHFSKVAFLNSDLTLVDRNRVVEECKQGNIDVLYMAPELLLASDLRWFLGKRRLGLLVIDEAHLITTWGREFRVDYWYLGLHIDKIRKAGEHRFPIIAVTATAVYGGENDMVYDSLQSLYLHNPHKFIGNVKRDDIGFVVNNHKKVSEGFDKFKVEETADFIRRVNEKRIKTIVYAPFRTHVDAIETALAEEETPDQTAYYHAGHLMDERRHAQDAFKCNMATTMVATKAFGMGIDIPDIQVVYHHAPSGTLADYVQEVGRAARQSGLKGYAAISYTSLELRYIRQLHEISAMHHWELREVLRKLYEIYLRNGKRKSFPVAPEDFGYIFHTGNLDQRVMTALMMIEKDYLNMTGRDVLTARRNSLDPKVFARIMACSMNMLTRRYPGVVTPLLEDGDYVYATIDLTGFWERDFFEESFSQLRRKFFKGGLLRKDHVEIVPQVKISINLVKGWRKTFGEFNRFCDELTGVLTKYGRPGFTLEEVEKDLFLLTKDRESARRIIGYLIDTYSRNKGAGSTVVFQRRKGGERYGVTSSLSTMLNSLRRCFITLFEGKGDKSVKVTCFKKCGSSVHVQIVNLANMIELLGLGHFEITGGEIPMISVSLNEPETVRRDAESESYRNSIVSDMSDRHHTNCRLMDYFFLNAMSDDDRWNFIEDFFLGVPEEQLYERYGASAANHADIAGYISDKCCEAAEAAESDEGVFESMLPDFPPVDDAPYGGNRLLTIDGVTKKVDRWIADDPLSFDKVIIKHNLRVPKDRYAILMSKLAKYHYPYYRDTRRLQVYIYDFPKQRTAVQANAMYDKDPVAFYRWWKTHRDVITMNAQEFLTLLQRVNESHPRMIVKEDKAFLLGKRPQEGV